MPCAVWEAGDGATLYTYKSSTDRLEQLHVASVTVQMEQRPFAAGGVCEAFKMRVIQADGTKGPIQVCVRISLCVCVHVYVAMFHLRD